MNYNQEQIDQLKRATRNVRDVLWWAKGSDSKIGCPFDLDHIHSLQQACNVIEDVLREHRKQEDA